jgi:preprotein translocase SecE subunit
MKKLLKFINGVKKELSRVRWPNRKYMIKYSSAVLLLSVFFASFFYLIDFLAALLKTLLR